MRLFDRLPSYMTINGKKVRLNLDFRNVLQMLDVLSRDELIPEAREWLALKCICKRPRDGMLPEVMKFLEFEPKTSHQKITDFDQDADLIRAAFLQEYGINLFRDKLHWFEFICLLSCLPGGNKYSDVLSIRARPMPPATKYNAKEREWLMKAKSEYRLKLNDKEQARKYEEDVSKIFAGLLKMIPPEGSENNGE